MKFLPYVGILAIAFAPMFLPTVEASRRPASPINYFQIAPQTIPTAETNFSTLGGGIPPVGVDVYVCQFWPSVGPGSSAVNLTVRTAGSNPVALLNAVPITPTGVSQGTLWTMVAGSMPDGCIYLPGGGTIYASTTGAVISALSGRY